jgi:hypothetical protein
VCLCVAGEDLEAVDAMKRQDTVQRLMKWPREDQRKLLCEEGNCCQQAAQQASRKPGADELG